MEDQKTRAAICLTSRNNLIRVIRLTPCRLCHCCHHKVKRTVAITLITLITESQVTLPVFTMGPPQHCMDHSQALTPVCRNLREVMPLPTLLIHTLCPWEADLRLMRACPKQTRTRFHHLRLQTLTRFRRRMLVTVAEGPRSTLHTCNRRRPRWIQSLRPVYSCACLCRGNSLMH